MKVLMTLLSNKFIDAELLADIASASEHTLWKWEKSGKIQPTYIEDGRKQYPLQQLAVFPQICAMLNSDWEREAKIKPVRAFSSIELFAGAGGLAIGLEQAGFKAVALNELDKHACATLRANRPQWSIIEGDIHHSLATIKTVSANLGYTLFTRSFTT